LLEDVWLSVYAQANSATGTFLARLAYVGKSGRRDAWLCPQPSVRATHAAADPPTRNFGELVAAAAACALTGNNTAHRGLADQMVQHRMYRIGIAA
jgi:hypothetical protein